MSLPSLAPDPLATLSPECRVFPDNTMAGGHDQGRQASAATIVIPNPGANNATVAQALTPPVAAPADEAMCSSLECRRGAPLEFAAHLSSTED